MLGRQHLLAGTRVLGGLDPALAGGVMALLEHFLRKRMPWWGGHSRLSR